MAGFDPTTLPGVTAVTPAAPASTGGNSAFDPTTLPGVVAVSASTGSSSNNQPDTASGGPIPSLAPATGNESPLSAGLKTATNFAGSLGNFGIGLAELPFKGAIDLAQIPGAAANLVKEQGAGNAIKNFATSLLPTAYQQLVPPGTQDILAGNIPAATQSFEENPVGNVAPYILAGREAAYKVSPEAGAGFDAGIAKVGDTGSKALATAATPITSTASYVGGKIGDLSRFTIGKATGLEPGTVKQVINSPSDFSKTNIAATTRSSVAGIIKDALDTRDNQLSESGAAYTKIRQSPDMIDVGTAKGGDAGQIENIIQKNTGLSLNEKGVWEPTATSPVDSPTDVAKVNRLYQAWKPYFEQGQMTQGEFLTLRGKLGTIANYEGIGKSSPLDGAAAGMRSDLNTAFRSQIPGLENADADYSSQSQELKTLSKGILDKDGNLTDAAINKIANASGKAKPVFLSKLEEISPGITSRIKALSAVEDIEKAEGNKVGTYGRAVMGPGSVLAGIATGNIPLVVSGITEAILASPNVSIPLLRAYGFSKDIVGGVKANLQQVASGVNQLPRGAPSLLPSASTAVKSPVSVGRLTGIK